MNEPELESAVRAALADRYAIERELGRGGMATVYLAHDVRLGRRVAIKVMLPEVSATLGVERFLREIRVAAQLNHPNILALHDSGRVGVGGNGTELLYYVRHRSDRRGWQRGTDVDWHVGRDAGIHESRAGRR